MNDVIVKDEIIIENLIYEVRGKEVMLDSEVVISKCHGYIYDKVITHYDVCKPISMFINIVNAYAKLGRR